MGGTGFGGTGVDIKTVNDTVNIIDGNTTPTAIAQSVWDAQLSAHAVAGSFGLTKQVLNLGASGGAPTGNTLVLDGSASLEDDFYNNAVVFITTGTAINQVRRIIAYAGVTQTATVDRDWTGAYVPTIGDTYLIFATDQLNAGNVWEEQASIHNAFDTTGQVLNAAKNMTDTIGLNTSPPAIENAVWDATTAAHTTLGTFGGGGAPSAVDVASAVWDAPTNFHAGPGSFGESFQPLAHGTAQGGTTTRITLEAGSSAIADFYKGALVLIADFTGAGQARTITSYDEVNLYAYVDRAWGTVPDGTSKYVILPSGTTGLSDIASAVWNALTAGNVTGGTMGGLVNDAAANTGGLSAIANAVWDASLSGHTTPGTFGQTLQLEDSGLAQGGAASTVTLKAGASSVTDFYKNGLIAITSGTGAGQSRSITAYDGATKIATVDRAWGTNPISGDGYIIHPAAPSSSLTVGGIAAGVWDEAISTHALDGTFGQVLQLLNYGQATAGASTTITLDAGASAVTSFYNNALLVITAGAGVGQARTITAYNGGTKQAIVDRAWGTNPNGTSKYMIVPTSQAPLDTASIADAVWDESLAGHTIVGSTGEKLSTGGGTIKFFSNGDTDNPIIVQVSSPKHTQVKITFSEPVVMTNAANGALNLGNYTIPGLTIISVASLTAQQVMLTTSPQTPDFLYSLSVINIEDLSGNPIL
jgi:hypothetical protein